MTAYLELSTCGSPIPWTAIVQYGQHHGLDSVMGDVLHTLIRSLESYHRKRRQRGGDG